MHKILINLTALDWVAIWTVVLACVLTLAGRWNIFVYFGEKGWKAIIPFVEDYTYGTITGCPKSGLTSAFFSALTHIILMLLSAICFMASYYLSTGTAQKAGIDANVPSWVPSYDSLISMGSTLLILFGVSLVIWISSKLWVRYKLMENQGIISIIAVPYVTMPFFVEPLLGLFIWNPLKKKTIA